MWRRESDSRKYIKSVEKIAKDGNLKSALAESELLVAEDPKNPMLHLLLGTVLASSGNTSKGLDEMRTAAELDPKNPLPPRVLGLFDYERKLYESSDLWLTKAVALAPKDAEAVQYRGLSRFMLSKTDGAMADFKQAEHLNIKKYRVICSLGLAHALKNERNEAIPALEECIKQLPDDSMDADLLAAAYADAGRRDDAIALVNQVLRTHPADDKAKRLQSRLQEPR
jgi:tetratricopeptide (TPR) repeat protein